MYIQCRAKTTNISSLRPLERVSIIRNDDFASSLRSRETKAGENTSKGLKDTAEKTTTKREEALKKLTLVNTLLLSVLKVALLDFRHHVLDCGFLVGASSEEVCGVSLAELALFVELAESMRFLATEMTQLHASGILTGMERR